MMLSHTIQALAADTWQTYFAGALASHWTVAAANNSSVSLQVAAGRPFWFSKFSASNMIQNGCVEKQIVTIMI